MGIFRKCFRWRGEIYIGQLILECEIKMIVLIFFLKFKHLGDVNNRPGQRLAIRLAVRPAVRVTIGMAGQGWAD